MTTIIAIQGDGFSAVCVDSRISDIDNSGYISQIFTLKEGNCKVAINGKYLLGAAGDMRAINILHHVFQPPTPPKVGLGETFKRAINSIKKWKNGPTFRDDDGAAL